MWMDFFCVIKNKRPFDTKKRPFDTKKRPFGRKNGRLRKQLGQTAVSWAKRPFLGPNGRFLGKTAVCSRPPTQKLFGSKQLFWCQSRCFDTKTGGCEIPVGVAAGSNTFLSNDRFLGKTGGCFRPPDTKTVLDQNSCFGVKAGVLTPKQVIVNFLVV
jgi:hypothetical protein